MSTTCAFTTGMNHTYLYFTEHHRTLSGTHFRSH